MNGAFLRRMAGATMFGAALVATAQPAQAQDKLNIVGTVNLYQTIPGAGGNLVIDFLPLGGGVGTISTVSPFTGNTGVFTAVGPGTLGANLDFVFGGNPPSAVPFNPPSTTTPVPFLAIGGYVFTATSFGPGNVGGTPILVSEAGGNVFAALAVQGFVTGPGLVGARPFTGSYTTQVPGTIASVLNEIQTQPCTPPTFNVPAGCGIGDVSISATFVVSAIPEPATVALMATGLLALAGASLRRRNLV